MNNQQQLKRWIIEGQFKLTTPMHLGTGLDEKEGDNWVAAIALDHHGKPYIPGASLKGALRALAQRHNCLNKNIFGDLEVTNNQETNSTAGQAEFYNAWFAHTGNNDHNHDLTNTVTRVAIDRVTGTAVDKKLFNTQLIKPGICFDFKIIIQNASEDEISQLLGLLKLAETDAKFSLGAGSNQKQGKIQWSYNITVKYLGEEQATKWHQKIMQGENVNWQSSADSININAKTIKIENTEILELPLALKFHTPFLVKQEGDKEKNEANAIPRRNHEGKVLLPASSLRGRLRSQTERILRTLGQETPEGHQAPTYVKGEVHSDLAALLFGATGWKGLIHTSDCVPKEVTPKELPRHEMVAIDRFTGGSKDKAKFNTDYVECPILEGVIHLDIQRLKQAKLKNYQGEIKPALKPALGLMTLLLRDLAEGDIPFGFGVNKGYGQCNEHSVLTKWTEQLAAIKTKDANKITVRDTLEVLRSNFIIGNAAEFPPPITETKPTPPQNTLEPASNGFHNPYHFIPLNQPNTNCWPEAESGVLKMNKHGHDQYHTDKFSGRIVCRLTTRTPLFVGAETKPSANDWKPSEAKPFKLNGKHAIPATSLRGMLSSLFESISNSNFRVLHSEKYSMRKTMNKALSAMGRVILDDDGTPTLLQPLTLPTLEKLKQQSYNVKKKWQQIYETEHAPLRIYFYKKPQNITNKCYYLETKNIELKNKSEITIKPDNNPKYPSKKSPNREIIPNQSFLLGQENIKEPPIIEKDDKYTRGWIRTLKNTNRDLPSNVKHHVFLPDTTVKINPLKIPPKIIDRFHELADLALAGMHIKPDEPKSNVEILPYVPIGRSLEGDRPEIDNPKTNTPRYSTRLKEGDIVFFDVDEQGQINEISFSSIWRQGIEKDGHLLTSTDLLSNYNANLLPLGMSNRCKLSPAERLFGVVEHRDSQDADEGVSVSKKQAFGYAGKVRVGFGLTNLEKKVETEAPITLKELSSPKPPSPALYLKPTKEDRYLSKTDVASQGNTTTLRGRKYYLHALRDKNGSTAKLNNKGQYNENGFFPWKTLKEQADNPHEFKKNKNKFVTSRQAKIQPIKPGTDFYFEIDFNNLDQTELAQLCATLQPTPEFEHRLGMGKPLGLGSVKIEPQGLYLIDRHQRYAQDCLDKQRYHHVWRKEDLTNQHWPTHLNLEQDSVDSQSSLNFTALTQKGMQKASPDIKRALELFGNPKYIGVPVHYPLEKYGKKEKFDPKEKKKIMVENGIMENEGFKWFVNNDDKRNNDKQWIKNITSGTTKIPTLNKN